MFDRFQHIGLDLSRKKKKICQIRGVKDSQSQLPFSFLPSLLYTVLHGRYSRLSRLWVRRIYHPEETQSFQKLTKESHSHRTMDSMSSVSPSILLPPSNPLPTQRHRPQVAVFSFATNNRLPRLSSFFSVPSSKRRLNRVVDCKCKLNGRDAREEGRDDDDDVDGEKEEVERALHLDGTIPTTSGEFLKRVSSRAYDMRRHLQQTFDSGSYDGKNCSLFISVYTAYFACFFKAFSTFCCLLIPIILCLFVLLYCLQFEFYLEVVKSGNLSL